MTLHTVCECIPACHEPHGHLDLPVGARSSTSPSARRINMAVVIFLMIGTFIHTGVAQPLASGKDKFLGSCVSTIRSDFTKYWNQVTPENAGKWSSVEGTQDIYNWTALDNIYNFAITNGFLYRHHNLVWGNQQPSWIATLDSASARAQVEEWIHLVGERYPNIDFIDVVNEPLNAPPVYKNALGGNGTTGWDWIITVFEWARLYCPNAKLHVNEYNIFGSNYNTTRYVSLIDTLKARGLIDGIGVQGHYFEFKGSGYSYPISTLKSNLELLAATGLPMYITEFDVNEPDDATQLANYKIYFPLLWDHPAVKGITLWGYAENAIWKPYGYLVDYRNAPRPALQWLTTYVAGPSIPILLSPVASATVPRNPKLIWHASASAASYQLQVAEDSLFGLLVVDIGVSDTVYQLNTLRANTTHYWHVNATNQYGTCNYSLTGSFVTTSTTVGIGEVAAIPQGFVLHQNYPNPFNPTTAISFQLTAVSFVRLNVYDELGREVATLVNEIQSAGPHTVRWNAQDVPAGVYVYRLIARQKDGGQAGSQTDSKKMLLVK